MSRDEFLWLAKYAPKTIKDCVLPESTKKTHDEWVTGTRLLRTWTSGGCVDTAGLKAELERALAFCEIRDQ